MAGAYNTSIAVKEMVFALPADQWQVRLIPDEDHSDLVVQSSIYTSFQLIKSVKYLRHENMNGYHVFARPITNRHVLVDDLVQNDIDALIADGLRPAVIVRTSKANYQAWITISPDEIETKIATSAARILADRYHGDRGSAHAEHLGRLPGFTNRKPKHWTETGFPFTGLHAAVRCGISPETARLIEEATRVADFLPSLPSTPLGACAPTQVTETKFDISLSSSSLDEKIEVYESEIAEQKKRLANSFPYGDRSRIDFLVAQGLFYRCRFDPNEIAAIISCCSEKASERSPNAADDYVGKTVNAACRRRN